MYFQHFTGTNRYFWQKERFFRPFIAILIENTPQNLI